GELADAQKSSEARLGELADAQKSSEARLGELADAQKRTEKRLEELSVSHKELAEAEKRTEARLGELADAQKRTEISVEKLVKGLDATRTELGGLSRSVSYSLENEAYRQLPRYLEETHGIQITDRMVRMEMDGEEINLFARGRKDGKEICIVGETELKLSGVGKLRQLEKKISVVRKHCKGKCIPLMITHFARPQVSDAAKKKGILIVQSFEW
ncbi:MAG: hypothetical protein R2941_09375, partial [Desulfobacterales bacterium]